MKLDYRDVITGTLLVFGTAVFAYFATHYSDDDPLFIRVACGIAWALLSGFSLLHATVRWRSRWIRYRLRSDHLAKMMSHLMRIDELSYRENARHDFVIESAYSGTLAGLILFIAGAVLYLVAG